MGAGGAHPLGDVAHGEGVHPPGPVRIGLAGVHRGPSGGVHHGVGGDGAHRLEYGVTVAHVEAAVVGADDVVAGAGEGGDQLPAELSPGPGDQHPHQESRFSGSHHGRLSRYHATVASSASPSSRRGCQPSARTLEASME